MGNRIDGTSILKQVKSRIEVHRNKLKGDLSKMKIVIFQFNPPPELTDFYEISKYKAADTSTAQKGKLFGDFLGCEVEVVKLPSNTAFKDFRRVISIHNKAENVKGIIIQYPVPKQLDPVNKKSKQIVQLIAADKDIDAMSHAGIERWGRCATADAICRVVDTGLKPGSKIVLVGSDGFVGRGVDSYLKSKEVALKLEINTVNKEGYPSTTTLDKIKAIEPSILVSATGKEQLITVDLLKDTNIDLLIDCGFVVTHWKDKEGRIIVIGDIDRGYPLPDDKDAGEGDILIADEKKDAYNSARFVTPVPKGTGPMEMAVLLERFMMKEFPQLKLEPWKLIKLDKLAAELANRSPEDKTPIDYLVDPEVEFRESIDATVIHRSKPPDTPGNGRALQ
jgi:methylenetetrahydrofolate dehydrogenase (NADP+) / methenyltetrahydrofolate cyclohydrolase